MNTNQSSTTDFLIENDLIEGYVKQGFLRGDYVYDFVNPTDKQKTVILFGANEYSLQPNFGNDEDVYVLQVSGALSYNDLLNYIKNKELTIGLISVSCPENNTLLDTFTINNTDAYGCVMSMPISPLNHFSPQQFQQNIVDIKVRQKLSPWTHFAFKLKPKSQARIGFFFEK